MAEENFRVSNHSGPEAPKQQIIRDETPQGEYKIPTELVDLPSKGYFYPEGHPFCNGFVEMKTMTAREEDILATESYINKGIVIDELLKSLLTVKIDFNTVLAGDRNAMMLAARRMAYGDDYDVRVESPEGKVITTVIDLSKLKYKELDPDVIVDNNINVIKCETPSGDTIHVKVTTVGDGKEIRDMLDNSRKFKRGGVNRTLTSNLKWMIMSINGNSDKRYISDYVDNQLLAADSRFIRKFSSDNQPDVDFGVEVSDPDTGDTFQTELPILVTFFYPDAEL